MTLFFSSTAKGCLGNSLQVDHQSTKTVLQVSKRFGPKSQLPPMGHKPATYRPSPMSPTPCSPFPYLCLPHSTCLSLEHNPFFFTPNLCIHQTLCLESPSSSRPHIVITYLVLAKLSFLLASVSSVFLTLCALFYNMSRLVASLKHPPASASAVLG